MNAVSMREPESPTQSRAPKGGAGEGAQRSFGCDLLGQHLDMPGTVLTDIPQAKPQLSRPGDDLRRFQTIDPGSEGEDCPVPIDVHG